MEFSFEFNILNLIMRHSLRLCSFMDVRIWVNESYFFFITMAAEGCLQVKVYRNWLDLKILMYQVYYSLKAHILTQHEKIFKLNICIAYIRINFFCPEHFKLYELKFSAIPKWNQCQKWLTITEFSLKFERLNRL